MPRRTGTMGAARARFVLDVEQSHFSFSAVCRRHGISRKTGYKWWDRYRSEGLDGLVERSHRTRSCPHATPEWMVYEAVRLRRRHKWGSKKIRGRLLDAHGWSPARSTPDQIFRRHGLVEPSRSRRRREHPGEPPFKADRPNAVWTADFKGEFRTGDGKLCYPSRFRMLTAVTCSRFALYRRLRSSTQSLGSSGFSGGTASRIGS